MKRLRCMAWVASSWVLGACGTRTIPVEVRFADQALADEATAIELYVVDRCADVVLGGIPTAPRSRVVWRRGERAMALAGTLPERFGVSAIARNDACDVVAAGCRDATRDDASVVVPVNDESGPGCTACTRGVCGVAHDAGTDASVDAAVTDASPRDAYAPPDAGPLGELSCDCSDDDLDGTIDEGCFERGSGEVIWQTVFDGPGVQGFRGAALGGDGSVYINGWMSPGSTNLCGTNHMGDGNGGTSWTIGLNAATGACSHVFARPPGSVPAPSSTFAAPAPGRLGAWLFTPRAVVELSGSTVRRELELNPPARFNSGTVRIHPSDAARALIYFRPETSPARLGDAEFDSMGASIVALVNGTNVRMTASPVDSHAAWLDSTRWVIATPNQLPSSCTRPASPWRIEVHASADAPETCERVLPLDIDSNGGEVAVAATATAVWVLAVLPDRTYALVATRWSDGTTASRSFPRAPDDVDTLSHLVPAEDGTVFVATTRGVPAEGGAFAGKEGYVHHLALDATGIRELGVRRFGGNISGLGLGPDNTVYVNAGADAWPLCSRTGAPVLTAIDGTAAVIGAIQF